MCSSLPVTITGSWTRISHLFVLNFSCSCDSPEKLKAILPRLEQELKDTGKFKDFYQFTFNFAKNPGQKGLGKFRNRTCGTSVLFLKLYQYTKSLHCFFLFLTPDLDMAVAYWNLVLTGRFKFLDLWNRFLLVSVGTSVTAAIRPSSLVINMWCVY